MTALTPTDEQAEAVRLAMTGGHLAIEAGAGCAKSTTLLMIAEAKKAAGVGNGIYCAFNKRVADDARGIFPRTTDCRTAHSLAFQAVGRDYAHRLNKPRLQSHQIAKRAGIEPMMIRTDNGPKRLAPGFLAGILVKATTKFCQSADEEPGWWHVPVPETMSHDRDLMNEWKNVRVALEPSLRKAWADLQDKAGVLPYSPDCYLKTWSLTHPKIECDYILADESQDLFPSWLSVMEDQRSHAQLVVVGDVEQTLYCQPVGTMVEVPVAPVAAEGHQCSEDGCGRKRDHVNTGLCDLHERQRRSGDVISDIPRYPRNGKLTVEVPIESLSEGDRVVTYWNTHVYKRGRPISSVTRFPYSGRLIRVTMEDGRTSSYQPQHHCPVRVGRHDSALESKHVVYLMRKGDQFRVGRVPFFYQTQHGSFGLSNRASQEQADCAWILSVHDSAAEAALAEALTWSQFNLPGIRFTSSTNERDLLDVELFWSKLGSNTVQASRCLDHFGRLLEYPLWVSGKTRLGLRRPFVTAAANLIDGFRMLPSGATETWGKSSIKDDMAPDHLWKPVVIDHQWYDGDLVSLEVADHHTYFADGILTHNSWRSSVNAMEETEVDHRTSLSWSFRFGEEIAEQANTVLSMIGSRMRLVGKGPSGRIGTIDFPDMVLCRTNAVCVRRALDEFDRGGSPFIVGGQKDVVSFARGALLLQQGKSSWHADLACFDSWSEVVAYVENDELGGELALLVKLVEDFGAERIVNAFDVSPVMGNATMIVSTVHKMKGGEAQSVQLADDFAEDTDEKPASKEDKRIVYVAVTRAQRELDVDSVKMLRKNRRQPQRRLPMPLPVSLSAVHAVNTSGYDGDAF